MAGSRIMGITVEIDGETKTIVAEEELRPFEASHVWLRSRRVYRFFSFRPSLKSRLRSELTTRTG